MSASVVNNPEPRPLPEIRPWELQVESVMDITSRLRLIRLTGPELANFEYVPGQDIMLVLSSDPQSIRRRYTIRSFDGQKRLLDLVISMHGDGPGLRWASVARPGDRVDAIGPRGKITLDGRADWHLFAGDETAIGGTFSMLEGLPTKVSALSYLLVTDRFDEQVATLESIAPRKIEWIGGRSARIGSTEVARSCLTADLPAGWGHAYVAGEVGLVVSWRNALLARGLARDQVSAKAYWNRGQANLDKGEPERRAS